jgi:hypothetical protein
MKIKKNERETRSLMGGEKKFNEESCEEMCLQEFLLKGNKEMIFFSQ